MTLKRQRQIDAAHPLTIVGDTDQSQPARFDVDSDVMASSIHAVVDQLFDDGSRTFDDLSSRNSAGYVFGQDMDIPRTNCGGHGAGWLFNSIIGYGLLCELVVWMMD